MRHLPFARLALVALAAAAALLSPARAFAEAASDGGRTPARAAYSCRLVTGYGTAVGYGPSRLAADASAREICGTQMINQYFAARGGIDAANVDDLALACINLDCQ